VLLAVPWYFPESNGGTEVYVGGLAQEFLKRGIEVAVAAPGVGESATSYVHDGIRVFRYPAPYASSGEIDVSRPEPSAWGEILDSLSPSVVDFHSLTSGLELAHLKAARRRGMSTVVTFHIPGVICARGTFMRFGLTPCGGDIAHEPCTACRLDARGTSPLIGRVLAVVPPGLGEIIGGIALPLSIRRAARATALDQNRRRWLQEIMRHADRLVAPSAWLVDVLLKNGAAADAVVLCRQGVDLRRATTATRSTTRSSVLRVGFLGRYDPVKGLHVLIEAVKRLPREVTLEVHVWGVARTQADTAYRLKIIAAAQGDPRIVFHDEAADPKDAYRQIDMLAVPSIGLETGPLVVLEAQTAGLPVLGSQLGGIAERVTTGVNGILVPAGDVDELSRTLRELAGDRECVKSLRPRFEPRTTADVADDTLRNYTALVGSRAV
jgi:glycosyltransferase involved in cell wall biosynthesis